MMNTNEVEAQVAEARAKIEEALTALREAETVVNTIEGRNRGLVHKAKTETLNYERDGIPVEEAQDEYNRLDAVEDSILDVAYTVRQGLRFFTRNQ